METLARFQLASRDLRFVTTAMKIVPDLERMADHAVNICQRAIGLHPREPIGGDRLRANSSEGTRP